MWKNLTKDYHPEIKSQLVQAMRLGITSTPSTAAVSDYLYKTAEHEPFFDAFSPCFIALFLLSGASMLLLRFYSKLNQSNI